METSQEANLMYSLDEKFSLKKKRNKRVLDVLISAANFRGITIRRILSASRGEILSQIFRVSVDYIGHGRPHRVEYLHASKVSSLFVYIRTVAGIILTFTTFPPRISSASITAYIT